MSDLLIKKVHGNERRRCWDATVSFWYVRGNFVAVIFGLQYTGSSVPGFVYLFVLIIWDDWKRRQGGDVLIQDWNLKLQSFNLNSIPVSSFFSCYLFNFCHWCKRKKKKEKKIWKDARCWFLSGWRITEVEDKIQFVACPSSRLMKIKRMSTTTVCLPTAITELLRQWHLFRVGTFCQDCSSWCPISLTGCVLLWWVQPFLIAFGCFLK